jgi:ATP-binding cassette, subfamily B, bacterial PglK
MTPQTTLTKEQPEEKSLVRELLQLAGGRLRRRLTALVGLSIFSAVAELFTVGAVVPLLIAAAEPSRLSKLPVVGSKLTQLFEIFGGRAVLASAVLLSAFALLAAIIRVVVLWLSQDLVYRLHARIVTTMYHGILAQDYEWFVQHNGSEFIATIDKVFAMTANLFVSVISAIPALFMSTAVVVFLLLISPTIAIAIMGTLGLLYLILAHFALRSVDEISRSATATRNRRTRFAQETWGAARDIIIDQSQAVYLDATSRLEKRFASLHVRAALIGLAPRIAIEASVIVLISIIVVLLASTPAELLLSLPLLGAFAIGGQRLIPMLQQIYLTYANQKIYSSYIEDTLIYARLAAKPVIIGQDRIGFESKIELENVSFTYPNGVAALSGVSLTITKRSKVGLVGKTGSGKSTLVDIIMGLLLPTEGSVKIDQTRLTRSAVSSWRSMIAHVPQSIFLADDTLLANVAFSKRDVPVDEARAMRACVSAGLAEFVEGSADGLLRRVGERGVQLSGGQRQRIGIARALYKGAEILVLDEATSALDLETEEEILDLIFSMPDVTVLMVSHRAGSLDRCDRIVKLDDGKVVDA